MTVEQEIGKSWKPTVQVPPPGPGESIVAPFTYQGQGVHRSIFSSGKVKTKMHQEKYDFSGCDFVKHDCPVTNGRGHNYTLDENGVTLKEHVCEHVDYFDEDQILQKYYPICCDLVKQVTGAEKVIAFDHNVRSKTLADVKAKAAGAQVQGPVFLVHNDYTVTSAPQRVRDLAKPPKANDTLRNVLGDKPLINPDEVNQLLSGRFAIINVWRNIKPTPIQKFPLGLCDGRTVCKDDIITFELHYVDRVGLTYQTVHNEKHRWVYFPNLTRDEAILIKCWDTAGDDFAAPEVKNRVPCTFSFHSAFEDPSSAPDADDRESIEVRTIAFFLRGQETPSKQHKHSAWHTFAEFLLKCCSRQ